MPGQPFVQVDAFTRESFGGNPAAVFLLPSVRDEGWMQRVAREMNQADTAFLVRGDDEFDLRLADALGIGSGWRATGCSWAVTR
jgi:PhzF family phenazine biosynthesis protein